MKTIPHISRSLRMGLSPLHQAFQRLSRRDQLALVILLTFLLLMLLGMGGVSLHQNANHAQKNYDTTMSEVFWLRSQAGNIKPPQAQNITSPEMIKQIVTQSGINEAQVTENADGVQLVFQHSQPSVVSNIFNQLTQQGITISQLQIYQATPEQFAVQAVVLLK